jgi:RNA polymerase sigma-70 factor (ECF subfamily)
MASSTPASAALSTALVPPRAAGRGELSERTLLKGALAGEEAALAQLYRRHWPAVYRVAYLIVHDHAAAEDVAQEAFVAAVRRLEQFDRRRPFAPWLLRIATNRAIDWTRSGVVRRELVAADAGETVAAREERPWAEGCSAPLMAALAALPVEQRAVVVLRHLLELTPGEIARMLELPRGTVNSRLRRGLDALEQALEGER